MRSRRAAQGAHPGDDLEGWDPGRGGRLRKEGMHVLICIIIQQKPTQHCKNKQTKKKMGKNSTFSRLPSPRKAYPVLPEIQISIGNVIIFK